MSDEAKCKGPGNTKGETCGRPVRRKGLCSSHVSQLPKGGTEPVLRPLLGPHGKKFHDASRLELRNMSPAVVATLQALGARLPATDKRETDTANRAARHLVRAYLEGGAKFKASHDPDKVAPTFAAAKAGTGDKGRVDLRHVVGAEVEAMRTLGAKVGADDKRAANLPLRGTRYLLQAYATGGVRLLASHAPKT